MNQNQFDILVYLERFQNEKITQTTLAKWHNISVGTVNAAINELVDKAYIENVATSTYKVTNEGYKFLEPYKVKRAVFFAAGFGSRLVPVTLNTPKPLIRVNGKIIIELLLDAVLDAGIEEIYIIRGYLKDQFDVLLKKYPMIKFIDNDIYNEANNISSAVLAKDMMENTLVLESDLVLYDPRIIRKYEYSSNYRSIYREITDDWCFETRGSLITDVMIGGKEVHEMVGISYWSKEDGLKMREDLHDVFNQPGGKELYWDEVPLRYRKNNYQVSVFEVSEAAIIEIDTFKELCEIDPTYKV